MPLHVLADQKATHGQDLSFTLTVGPGYTLPGSVTVKVSNVTLTAGEGYTHILSGTSAAVVVKASYVKGPISVTVTAIPGTVDVSDDGKTAEFDLPPAAIDKITDDDNGNMTIDASSYDTVETISLTPSTVENLADKFGSSSDVSTVTFITAYGKIVIKVSDIISIVGDGTDGYEGLNVTMAPSTHDAVEDDELVFLISV